MTNAESIGTTPMPDRRLRTVFVEANGLTFEIDQCGSGDKLALCLHGFPEHSSSWRYQLPMLADLGYEAWAPNMRGYGKSSRPGYVEDYAMPLLLADIAGLIDAAGKAEVVLIAHDWGALLAWEFAIQKIRPLQKLIICNVPHPAAAREAFSFTQLRKSWYILFFQIPCLPEKLLGRRSAKPVADAFVNTSLAPRRFPPEVISVYQENAAQPGALTAMVNYYRALLRHPLKVKRDKTTPVIATPTLIVWGEGDAFLGKELTYATGKYVENLQIRYLADVSHWVQQEAPEVTNAMIEAFLNEAPVPYAKWQMNLVSEDDAGIS